MLRRLKRLFPDRLEAKTDFFRFERGEEFVFEPAPMLCSRHAPPLRRRGAVGNADGGELAETVCPHFLSRSQSYKSLGRASTLLPILFIFGPNLVHERKARIPIARAFGLLDPWKVRHEGAVGPRRLQRHDAMNVEVVGRFRQFHARLGQEVSQVHCVARPDLQIVRQPLVDDYLVVAHPRWRERRASGGDHRVRCRVGARRDQVGQVGQDESGVGVFDPDCGGHHGRLQENSWGAKLNAPGSRRVIKLQIGVL